MLGFENLDKNEVSFGLNVLALIFVCDLGLRVCCFGIFDLEKKLEESLSDVSIACSYWEFKFALKRSIVESVASTGSCFGNILLC